MAWFWAVGLLAACSGGASPTVSGAAGAAAGQGAAGASGTSGAAGVGAAGTAGAAGTGAAGAAGAMAGSGGGGAGTGAADAAGAPDGGSDASSDAPAEAPPLGADAGFGMGGPSRCATAGTLLCEDFENGLDATTWSQLVTTDGTVTVDDVHAFRGTKALHVKVVNTGHKAAISETKTFPIASNVLYARMYVWFDVFTTQVHFTMAEAPQTGAGAWARFGGQGGKFGVGTDHGASGDWLQQDTVPVPVKQWTCIEFELAGDTNMFHVWQDDVARPALDTGANKHAGFVIPPMTSLWFGWQTYSNQAPGELWIDEIAVDSKRIGCAR
jgi:hypothetical protein